MINYNVNGIPSSQGPNVARRITIYIQIDDDSV